MRRVAIVIGLLLLGLVPTAQAAWTTSAGLPASFRPDRDVAFSYTATSNSATDLPLQWRVNLYTCQDIDADTWCEFTDAHRVDHGQRTISLVGGQSATVTWTVGLNSPVGSYRYHFDTGCINNPCPGTFQPGGVNNRTGAFQLAYTNTWARSILATTPTSAGSTQTVTYRMASTSLDDRDLAGTAELYTTPAGEPEESQGAKAYAANANSVLNVAWTGIAFPNIGTQRLRAADTNAADTTLDVVVRGVHLHALQPRAIYEAGARSSLYFTLEGHGASPDPQGIIDDIVLIVKNGAYTVANVTLRTEPEGRAYASVNTADDHDILTWTAQASGTWLSINYDLIASGVVQLEAGKTAEIRENVSAIRANLSDLQLRGVHLDELGSRNVWILSVRAVGAVALVLLLIVLVIVVAIRV